jgi:hypothetical protein
MTWTFALGIQGPYAINMPWPESAKDWPKLVADRQLEFGKSFIVGKEFYDFEFMRRFECGCEILKLKSNRIQPILISESCDLPILVGRYGVARLNNDFRIQKDRIRIKWCEKHKEEGRLEGMRKASEAGADMW